MNDLKVKIQTKVQKLIKKHPELKNNYWFKDLHHQMNKQDFDPNTYGG